LFSWNIEPIQVNSCFFFFVALFCWTTIHSEKW